MSTLLCLSPDHYGKKIFCRPGGDERILKEVLHGIYRRKSIGFDVCSGERWLDLGANIGAFAIYCELRGAQTVSYEPDQECFEILKKNLSRKSQAVCSAVTASDDKLLTFYSSPAADPLVLDNLISEIRPAAQRKDLLPVYAFNAEGLYLPGAPGGKRASDSKKLSRWQDLLKKMKSEGFAIGEG